MWWAGGQNADSGIEGGEHGLGDRLGAVAAAELARLEAGREGRIDRALDARAGLRGARSSEGLAGRAGGVINTQDA